jgi:hypothetical protein
MDWGKQLFELGGLEQGKIQVSSLAGALSLPLKVHASDKLSVNEFL